MECFLGLTVTAILSAIVILTPAINGGSSNNNKVSKSETASEEKIEIKEETESEEIDYKSVTVEDNSMEYGSRAVRTRGQKGLRTIIYKVMYKGSERISKEKLTETVKNPVDEVIAVGTRIIWRCVDATSYDKNPYNDNKCTSSTGEIVYVSDSQSIALDPSYSPGKAGHYYYNSF